MIDSIHSLNLLVLWAQFLKDLGVLNSLYAGGLVMSSIASLTPCQSHRWWCCVLDATFLWQGLRWQWFHRLCYLVCILWVEKLVAFSGCVICPFWHLQLRRVHIQHHVYMNNLRRSFWKSCSWACTRCKLLSQTLESFQDMNRTWHVLKTQGFQQAKSFDFGPFRPSLSPLRKSLLCSTGNSLRHQVLQALKLVPVKWHGWKFGTSTKRTTPWDHV